MKLKINTDAYFDGYVYYQNGPFQIIIENGRIVGLTNNQNDNRDNSTYINAKFVMPSFTEAHCHLFLDGDELDTEKRSDYLKRADILEMTTIAVKNIDRYLNLGVTLIRDAGDIYGVNTMVKKIVEERLELKPIIRKPGKAIRKKNKYGSFMALEVDEQHSIEDIIDLIAPNADDLKVILTGIIDFEAGTVKGTPQFNWEETQRIVKRAQRYGLLTFAHCSGIEGLELAVKSGLNSIEHGFFMNKDILLQMYQKNIAWVPTFCPVYFQWENPSYAKWNQKAIDGLFHILKNHLQMIKLAYELKVNVVLGTDAGSYGVPHGFSIFKEILCLLESGASLENILSSATVVPRKLWGEPDNTILVGNEANFITLKKNPFKEINALTEVSGVYYKEQIYLPKLKTGGVKL